MDKLGDKQLLLGKEGSAIVFRARYKMLQLNHLTLPCSATMFYFEFRPHERKRNLSRAEVRPSGFIRTFDPFRSEAEKKLSEMRPETDEEET